jgi:hypothetical protein
MVLECPGDIRTNVTGVASAQGDCGEVTVSYNDVVASGCGGTKVVARTWTATDTCDNATNAVQLITVQDTTPPILIPAPDRTVTAGAAWEFAQPEAADNCSSVTVSVLNTVTNAMFQLAGQDAVPVTRMWLATDAASNTNTCQQTITIVMLP